MEKLTNISYYQPVRSAALLGLLAAMAGCGAGGQGSGTGNMQPADGPQGTITCCNSTSGYDMVLSDSENMWTVHMGSCKASSVPLGEPPLGTIDIYVVQLPGGVTPMQPVFSEVKVSDGETLTLTDTANVFVLAQDQPGSPPTTMCTTPTCP